jgi:hypothetical protein
MRASRRSVIVVVVATLSQIVAPLVLGGSCAVPDLDDTGKRCTDSCPSGLPCVQGICGGPSSTMDAQGSDTPSIGVDASNDGAVVPPNDAGSSDAPDAFPPLRVFVSRAAVPPNQVLSVCSQAANAANLKGTFVPWLLRDEAGAPPIAGPYVLVGPDQVLAMNAPQTGLTHAIDRTEDGGAPGANTEVWTGAQEDGGAFFTNCADWTSADGSMSGGLGNWTRVDSRWSTDHGGVCSSTLSGHVYCFEKR